MGLMVMLAIKKAMDEKNKSRYTLSKKNNYDNKRMSYGYSEYNIVDDMIEEMKQKNSIFFDFFESLVEEYLNIINSKLEPKQKNHSELVKQYRDITNEINKINDILKDKNISLEGFGNNSFMLNYLISFNCDGNYEDIKNDMNKRLDEYKNELDRCDRELNELYVLQKDKERTAKYAIIDRANKKVELDQLYEKIKELENTKQDYSKKINILKDFISIISENDVIFEETINKINKQTEINNQSIKLYDEIQRFDNIRFGYRLDDDIMKEAFEKLYSEGKISQELIEKMDKLIGKQEKMNNDYNSIEPDKRFVNLPSHKQALIEKACNWYIENVYNVIKDNEKNNLNEENNESVMKL